MKSWIIVLGFAFLLMSNMQWVNSFVPFEEVDGIKYKFYLPDTIKEECFDVFNKIPDVYKEDLKYVKVLPYSNYYAGVYWYNTHSIDLFNTCDEEIIIHELAHHCQYKKGDSYIKSKHHKGLFYECVKEIMTEVKIAQIP